MVPPTGDVEDPSGGLLSECWPCTPPTVWGLSSFRAEIGVSVNRATNDVSSAEAMTRLEAAVAAKVAADDELKDAIASALEVDDVAAIALQAQETVLGHSEEAPPQASGTAPDELAQRRRARARSGHEPGWQATVAAQEARFRDDVPPQPGE